LSLQPAGRRDDEEIVAGVRQYCSKIDLRMARKKRWLAAMRQHRSQDESLIYKEKSMHRRLSASSMDMVFLGNFNGYGYDNFM
jgi:hypothetical protein